MGSTYFVDHMTYSPAAEVDVKWDLGNETTKAVDIGNNLVQGLYLLGNQTVTLLRQANKNFTSNIM